MEIIKKKGIRSVFSVKEKIFLSPHYIRIVFDMTEQQVKKFANARIGAHNKIFIPAPGSDEVLFPDDAEESGKVASVKRTYTTRHIDTSKKELWIDFIDHADHGPASYWACRAVAGSKLGIAMKEGNRPLFPEAAEYFFVGDSTAIPVISAMMEQLPDHVKVKAILEVYGKEDMISLSSHANTSIDWVYNEHPEMGSNLFDIVQYLRFPNAQRFFFFAGEFDSAKKIRQHFKETLDWLPADYSVVSYWKRGASEDESSLLRSEDRRS
ncbi:siderophore-interacting protein [Pedobacter caeni]|uniref:NADPH-dependent ferric siderophore reductase, contains FAD-binding and SIP domains n=1 Tax=Pedobacter caeni TaxID=288992 RepID=A0A1M4TLN0_9SPHI|nr:siderophore-interacting protein [Pedobacter caeni]SHE45371.1 NADPH-dependent ferric siderophore reductase, contains FAD-binding and SIP domains [Pedobacter caeni]